MSPTASWPQNLSTPVRPKALHLHSLEPALVPKRTSEPQARSLPPPVSHWPLIRIAPQSSTTMHSPCLGQVLPVVLAIQNGKHGSTAAFRSSSGVACRLRHFAARRWPRLQTIARATLLLPRPLGCVGCSSSAAALEPEACPGAHKSVRRKWALKEDLGQAQEPQGRAWRSRRRR